MATKEYWEYLCTAKLSNPNQRVCLSPFAKLGVGLRMTHSGTIPTFNNKELETFSQA